MTDLIVSPEIVQDIRSMAYNAINSKDADNSAPGGTDGLAAPDELRMDIFRNAGIPEFYGLGIMEINELGINQKFNDLFDTAAGSTTYYNADGASIGMQFDTSTDDFVLGVDRSKDALIRAVAVDAESGSEFNLIADDQYSIRQNKIGYFGSIDEGRVVLDNRVLVGKIVGP